MSKDMRKRHAIVPLIAAIGAVVMFAGPSQAATRAHDDARAAAAGPIVFVSTRANGSRELYVVNRDGSGLRRLTYNSLEERQPAWSPDRSRIAFSALDPTTGNWDIYSVDANGGDLRRLTTDPERDDAPQWTSDGRIVYQHGPFSCPCQAWIVNADGSGTRQLPTGPGNAITPTASPGGDTIAFSSDRAGNGTWAIYTMKLNGQSLKQITLPTAGMDAQPRFSPNGNDIAFVRDNGTQDNDIYVVHTNGQGLTRMTNTPDRSEFWLSWSGSDVVFSALGPNGWHLYSIPTTGGGDSPLSTWPKAPFVEGFDGPALDSSLWHVISDPGGSVGIDGGRLVASISGSAVPGGQYNQVDEHIGSQCTLNGDFDLQVDYSLLTWPDFGGVYAALQAFFGNGGISRNSGPWTPPYNQQYVGWTDTGYGSINTLDTSGTLRLVRTSGTLATYERSGSSTWTLVFAGNAPNPVVYGMGLWADGSQFAHEDASVAFDDFRLSSGAVTCPDWWQDLAPDVAG